MDADVKRNLFKWCQLLLNKVKIENMLFTPSDSLLKVFLRCCATDSQSTSGTNVTKAVSLFLFQKDWICCTVNMAFWQFMVVCANRNGNTTESAKSSLSVNQTHICSHRATKTIWSCFFSEVYQAVYQACMFWSLNNACVYYETLFTQIQCIKCPSLYTTTVH